MKLHFFNRSPSRLLRALDRKLLNQLFDRRRALFLSNSDLMKLLCLKLIGPAVCLLLPVPMGLFTPCFVAGATVGWTFSKILGFTLDKVLSLSYTGDGKVSMNFWCRDPVFWIS